MTDFTTGAGATIGLSAATPGTYDETGYNALTYTSVGKVTNFGNIPSRVYQVVSVKYLGSAGTDKAKGSYDLGNQQITLALDADDAGQTMLDAAINSTDAYSIKLAHPVLGVIYARALVMGGPKTWGDNDTASTQQITLEYKMATVSDDGVVAVAAT